jgi:hypothetical protein
MSGYASLNGGAKRMNWRILEKHPGVFVVQKKGWLWGWNTAWGMMSECDIEHSSAEEAEAAMRKYMAYYSHEPRVVKEA